MERYCSPALVSTRAVSSSCAEVHPAKLCRQGIASKLVRRCEAAARALPHIEVIALHLDPKNGAAEELYLSLGYYVVTPGGDSRWAKLLGINGSAALTLMVKDLRAAVEPVSDLVAVTAVSRDTVVKRQS